ncbi:hypothetical protein [Catalinimonas niigatensis]|uniref:hypothetical protein n=1 Tax=Catalinimonas niigatensis TaxID=1397264 RepID=UPI00266643BA|nr:hypothetical protein [Catalinimonas niigatensis]WPP48941.1 hypothetical protein PZB72_19940 [Catalinimonas niigatensis]
MSDEKIFLAPVLTGPRFEDHTLPVSILEDFSALEELILELAKKMYLDQNPSRKRVPKGFSDGVYLKLSDIKDGSTIPQFIVASAISASTLLPINTNKSLKYIEQARDRIIKLVEDANLGKSILLEQKYLSYFNRIGKNLQEDEAIFFAYDSNKKAVLNKTIRKRILLSREEKLEYSETIAVNALIPSIDKKNNSFTLEIENNEIECSLDNDFAETIFIAFDEYENHTLVSLKATGIFNYQEKLIRVEDIEAMDVLDPFDVSVRISQLSKLPENWYEGSGKAPNKNALVKFEELFKSAYNSNLPLPAIFPTIEGNIQLEWSNENKEISLEINLEDLKSSFFYYNFKDDSDEYEQDLDLSNEDIWKTLNTLVEKYI